MTFEKFLFYCFAAVLVSSALMVVTRRNPVHAALFLVLAFFAMAGVWMLTEAEFLAITLVLVYVGAVMVLFLFVVMMLDIDIAAMRAGFIRQLPMGLAMAVVMLATLVVVVGPGNFGLDQVAAPAPKPADWNNTAALGAMLYTAYIYPFEIAAVILLVAIIAAIGLTLRQRPATKYIDPSLQVRVKKGEDRVRVIQVASEPRIDTGRDSKAGENP